MNQKIAVLCNYELLPERVGGMDYFFWQFDAKCKENNIQVDWLFPNTSNHGNYPDLNILYSETENIEAHFLNYCKQNQTAYSHIITHFIELCTPFFKEVKQLSKAKIIGIDHNPRPLNGYDFKKKVMKRIKGFLFSRYIDLFVGVSNYTVAQLKNDFGNHIHSKTRTIYNGIIAGEIFPRKERSKKEPKFLVVSHLRESKGIQDLIQAVSLLPEAIKKEISIDIYGDGPYKIELQEQIKELALETCFNFKGSSATLNSTYCNYDYMLQPTHMECFSLSILESLAANVPVVTTNVGGNQEVITHAINGYIFKAKDVFVLTVILEDLYSGVKNITVNTRPEIQDCFSLEQMVQHHFSMLSQL